MSTIAVYPGTFDPMTLGHQDLIRRGAVLFGTIIVAVATAHHKKTLFSLDERLDMVREVVAPLGNVSVLPFNGLPSTAKHLCHFSTSPPHSPASPLS
jgi:pantetheine-phosphate adenylyltransferase